MPLFFVEFRSNRVSAITMQKSANAYLKIYVFEVRLIVEESS